MTLPFINDVRHQLRHVGLNFRYGHPTMSNHAEQASPALSHLSHPGTAGYADVPQFLTGGPLPFRRTIRRPELHQIVPLAETTIYEMEQRGEFPWCFRLTARCVVWDLEEIKAWIEARKQASRSGRVDQASGPDVRQRKRRPVRNNADAQ